MKIHPRAMQGVGQTLGAAAPSVKIASIVGSDFSTPLIAWTTAVGF
jgi:hypothetical protein